MRNFYIITGHNRVGKTTLAKLLKERLESSETTHSATILPFGEFLKKELEHIGFPREFIDEKSQEARALMRSYGAARRVLDNRHFIKQWEGEALGLVSTHLQMDVSIIADDVYHHNELAAMLRMAKEVNANIYFVAVEREGFEPDEEALKSSSVREAREILDLFSYQRSTSTDDYEEYLLCQYTEVDIDILSTAELVFVYNEYRTPESYNHYLQVEIIPQLQLSKGVL